MQRLHDKIPIGVRCIIFSYFDFITLLKKVAFLTKRDREMLTKSTIINFG
jgi:hypothetical protein